MNQTKSIANRADAAIGTSHLPKMLGLFLRKGAIFVGRFCKKRDLLQKERSDTLSPKMYLVPHII